MKFLVLFEDNSGVGEAVRATHMAEHLAFLDRNRSTIHAAGPLWEADGTGAGGAWIVTAEGASDVQRLVEDDPFWPTGLRKSVRILAWRQVFADGRRLI